MLVPSHFHILYVNLGLGDMRKKMWDGRPPGKTRLLLEEVLVRPAGGAHPAFCVGPNAPV